MAATTFYQAAQLSDEEIKAQFIVRKKEFERVISEIRRDDMMGSIQHYIFVGQRGSGKSTLLRRIEAEVNTDSELKGRLVAVNLSEEQAGIYRLHDLWDRVCQELQEKGFEVDAVKWEDYEDDLTAYARALYSAMQRALQKNGKKLVLLLDNIDRILENIKTDDNHLFRELLINHKDVRIIGGSTRLSEHHWKYDQPFYEFFNITRLEPLTQDELKELLVFWSKCMNKPELEEFVKKHAGRLHAVRILSDGMPRTMLHFVKLLIDRPEQNGYDNLKSIVDSATPIYQERLATLSPLHQKIVLEMSFFWEAVKVGPLSQATKIESKKLSALLSQLVDLQIVEKIKGTGKNYLYRLQERFFNFWLIMTQGGPKQKSQVKYLTVFLETWYDGEELKGVYSQFFNDLTTGKVTADYAMLMTKALVHSKYLSVEERDSLIDKTGAIVNDNKEYYGLLPARSREIFKKAEDLIEKNQLDKALGELESIRQEHPMKYFGIGAIYQLKKKNKEAEAAYLKAVNLGNVEALYTLAILYYEDKRNGEEAYDLIAKHNAIENQDKLSAALQIVVAVWLGKLEQLSGAKKIIQGAVDSNDIKPIEPFLTELLIHHQKNIVWQWFQDAQMGEKLRGAVRPLYYATARLINSSEMEEMLLAQAPELQETVDKIYNHILQRQEFYYGKKARG